MAVSYPKSEKFAPTKQEQPAVRSRAEQIWDSCRGGGGNFWVQFVF
ncbi:hypothetical protein SLEP1_g26249 [Rubroshorea leprosula]|uniref:Uncharacterized protein n=1 Tax=Rubroshorea leprosula TaxID=152421 RepID=A0AAV5JYW5_9ROSI|nr:hypothetical protein SLEP1_g26249 [Rubroshorea leprosula]